MKVVPVERGHLADGVVEMVSTEKVAKVVASMERSAEVQKAEVQRAAVLESAEPAAGADGSHPLDTSQGRRSWLPRCCKSLRRCRMPCLRCPPAQPRGLTDLSCRATRFGQSC